MDRPHTGRKRNEAAREAILDAAMRLLQRGSGEPVTVDTLAAEAGVGKQTIYRWWKSKGEVFLDAMDRNARAIVPEPDTGSLAEDLELFLAATFRGGDDSATTNVLRAVALEAAGNPAVAELLRGFTGRRRDALHTILERGRTRGELAADADLDLVVDEIFGLLWYRILLQHRGFGPTLAATVTRTIMKGNS